MESVLLPNEIEIFIDAMRPQKMVNIGSFQWMNWHEQLQKLNQEALIEATMLKEEQVKELLVSFQKTKVLIHEIVLINIWKYKVLPQLLKLQPHPESTFIAYSVLYHEAVCIALLELVLFHPSCCEALGDSAVDLLDYSYGSASQLLSLKPIDVGESENAKKELNRQRNNLSFEIGIRCLSIIRYMSENLDGLSLSVRSRMYMNHDVPVLFCQLLISPPWLNGDKYYSGGTWKTCDNEQLGQPEAQVWLTLRQLLLDEECLKYYTITDYRRSQFMKILPIIKPTLLDQLSPLIELKHWLYRLSMVEQTAPSARPLLLEPVLEIKESILQECRGKWKSIAEKQLPNIFTNDKNVLKDVAKKLSEAYNPELIEKLEVKEKANCCECGRDSIQRCSRCKKAWYCSRSCQVNHWPQHKEDCAN